MRIIAGVYKGRTLAGPKWAGLRPTSDKLRETLFNILGPSVQGSRVLDAYAGTGALGIEALSRGAAFVAFVERDPRAQALIAENLRRCGVSEGYAMIRAASGLRRRFAEGPAFDLILIDPPYDEGDLGAAVAGVSPWLTPGGRLVLEYARRRQTPPEIPGLVRVRTVESGDSALAFYRQSPSTPRGSRETGTAPGAEPASPKRFADD
jgi:16S rRNA (guanine(966)-N(2))-methyltransferase RsmD